jgi:hypothetical protein
MIRKLLIFLVLTVFVHTVTLHAQTETLLYNFCSQARGPHLCRVYLTSCESLAEEQNGGAPLLALFEKWLHPTVET